MLPILYRHEFVGLTVVAFLATVGAIALSADCNGTNPTVGLCGTQGDCQGHDPPSISIPTCIGNQISRESGPFACTETPVPP